MKKILVPTDFSECANIASEAAIKMAKMSSAEILFLHYMAIPVNWIHLDSNENKKMYPDVTKKVRAVTNQLETLVQSANKEGVKAQHHIAFNNDSSNVINHIEEFGIDFVVMGSHGVRGIKEFFLGSNAQKMIRQAIVPVLIIKKKLETMDKPNIVFLSDFELDMLPAFRKIVDFADILNASIQLLYINTPSDFQDTWTIRSRVEKFRHQIKDKQAQVQIIDALDFEEGLAKYCKGLKCGMIAMISHHKGLFHRNEKAESIVNHLDLPFFSVNN